MFSTKHIYIFFSVYTAEQYLYIPYNMYFLGGGFENRLLAYPSMVIFISTFILKLITAYVGFHCLEV